MKKDIFLSIIVPVFNEERILERNLIKIIEYCKSNFKKYEVLLVDDGSLDRTVEICEKYSNSKISFLRNSKNLGKGYSVRKGVLRAKGDYIFFTDCDLSTPIEELGSFLKLILVNDIVIGSRALKNSKVKTRFSKKLLGRVGNLLISFFVKDIKDTQCGFKLFRKDVAKKIFLKQTIKRWGFDFEILFIAQKFNLKIKEEPVKWIEDKNSKVKLLDYPKTLSDLIKIKLNDFGGKYD